ncbi:hypothetical protein JQC67_07185 [Aurantibacter crassamenti]|uniref:hypothetical protein n=1 Tax=Aurantibacter crassamenti TaxID=1837375 RepID=UPI0019396ED4|nr:hypothetical protein [Aurantibacter crassamenti]MBM1105914.1 hypothetical protein [Aurantibacter crassamenti]
MKKVIVLMMLLVGVTTIAQGKKERSHSDGMKNLTAEQVATLQTKKMTLALDLTKGQQTQIQALNLKNAKARKAKMDERKASKIEGERKKPTSEERFAMQNARLDAQIAQKSEMKSILSEDQMIKWEKMHHNKRKQRGKKGFKKERQK